MSDKLPPPVTVEHVYLAAILSEIQALNELLAANLAPAAPVVGGGGEPITPADVIELREKRKRGK